MTLEASIRRLRQQIAADIWREVLANLQAAIARHRPQTVVRPRRIRRRTPAQERRAPVLHLVSTDGRSGPLPPVAAASHSPAQERSGWRELVVTHVALARGLARKHYIRSPTVGCDLADFEGAAFEGLVQAAQRWDRSRARNFSAFARFRITGAIQDWLRTTYPASCPRWENDRRRRLGLEKVEQRAVGAETLAFVGQEERGFRDTEARLTLDALVAKALLNDNQRHVLGQRLAGQSLKDIGAGLGVTESRACQIYAEVEQMLRQAAVA